MFRKILFLLILTSLGAKAQQGLDVTCFNVSIPRAGLMDYYEEGRDQYVVCKDQKVTIPANYEVKYLNRTDQYTVEPITYNPYPFTGTEIKVPIDGRAESDVDIPFNFCFFDQAYTKISVWSNGLINLTDGVSHKGTPSDPPPAGCTQCTFNEPHIPLPKTGPGWTNSISGIYKHSHWGNTGWTWPTNGGAPTPPAGEKGSINWAVYGEAPCRAFVINFKNMPSFALTANTPDCTFLPPSVQTSQIVLYETTNVIEVHVERHDGCPLDERGIALIGINGPTGTVGYTPPGRNGVRFDTAAEAWRFGPSGDPMWRAEWFVDGKLVSNNAGPVDVVIDKKRTVRVDLIVETCDEEYTDFYEVAFRPAIELDDVDLDRVVVCDKDQNTYDLNLLAEMIKEGQSGGDLSKLRFLYYTSEDDATDKKNQITNPRQFPIEVGKNEVYIRVESEIAQCYEIVPATIIKAPVEVKVPKPVNLCSEYTLPPLTDDEFYYKVERLDEDASFVVETLPPPSVGQVINVAGFYRVSIKKVNEYGCEDVKSFILYVENCSYPKGISPNGDGNNDNLDLTYNNVMELKVYNRYGKLVYEHDKKVRYKRQWAGQDSSGKQLPSGTYFLYVRTKNGEYQDWIQLMYEVK